MAGRIPQQFIDEVLARTDIVALIDSRVPLKKAGKDYVARCPFHDEKTPSFTVSPDKQFYHCFGCGAHGSAIGFLMEYDHLDFREAVEELARQAGLSLPQTAAPDHHAPHQGGHDIPALHRILEQATHYYQAMLRRHPQRERAVDYLKGRGVSGEIAKRFELGYAPPGWHNLEEALGRDAGTRDLLLTAGLLTRREDDRPPYDRFRDRIMFPIRDHRGRVVGFGGRLIDGDGPKYLNSPESPVFHKGEELYGLYQARRAGELRRLLVVEGYMDVVALAQHGIHYAAATLGTALTPEHLRRIYRVVDEAVFCFDGDAAGEAAAWRAAETLLPFLDDRRSARFVFLPQGRDPDDHVRAVGKAAFEAEIERSVTFSDFFLDRLGREADLRSMDGHARLIQRARPLLTRLPTGARREELLARLAARIQWEPQDLARHLGLTSRRPGPAGAPGQARRPPSLIARTIALLLQEPRLAALAGDPQRLAELDLPGASLLQTLLETLQNAPDTTLAQLLERWRGRPEAEQLARIQHRISPVAVEALEDEFRGAMERIDARIVERHVERLLYKSRREGLSEAEKRRLQDLLRRQHAAEG